MKSKSQLLQCMCTAVTLTSTVLICLWTTHHEFVGTPIIISAASGVNTSIAISTASDVNTSIAISTASDVNTSIAISTASDVNTSIAISTASDVNTSITTFILTTRFGGQQGAGLRGLVSQQCFISNLGIPAYIVEPFVVDSVLGHTTRNEFKFSDMFNLDTFNHESKKLGYGPILRLEYFLKLHVPERAILVELRSGGQKSTKVLWDGYNTPESPCYNGR